MDKVGIVVLNYLNYEDTIECVYSLLNIDYNDYKIVIVDNGSENDSFKKIRDEFEDNKKIYLINTEKNLGYAKGNNFGIDYCRNNLSVNHVLIINNDTIVRDRNLLDVFVANKSEGIILGPKIINLEGKNQNPLHSFPLKIMIYQFIEFISQNFIKHLKNILTKKTKTKLVKKYDDFYLHGACLFFTEDYFKYYNGFFNKTFLYFEENILYLLIKKIDKNLKYIDSTSIIHKEDRSSELFFKNKDSVKRKYMRKSFIWFLILYLLPYFIIKKLFDI
jgi:GT2 family glycosyltransferase